MTFIIELTSLIKTSSQTVILMNIIYIALKTSFKKQHFFELTSLLKMDLTFIIKFAQKLTSLIKMDLTSLFKTSFKKQPSAWQQAASVAPLNLLLYTQTCCLPEQEEKPLLHCCTDKCYRPSRFPVRLERFISKPVSSWLF